MPFFQNPPMANFWNFGGWMYSSIPSQKATFHRWGIFFRLNLLKAPCVRHTLFSLLLWNILSKQLRLFFVIWRNLIQGLRETNKYHALFSLLLWNIYSKQLRWFFVIWRNLVQGLSETNKFLYWLLKNLFPAPNIPRKS